MIEVCFICPINHCTSSQVTEEPIQFSYQPPSSSSTVVPLGGGTNSTSSSAADVVVPTPVTAATTFASVVDETAVAVSIDSAAVTAAITSRSSPQNSSASSTEVNGHFTIDANALATPPTNPAEAVGCQLQLDALTSEAARHHGIS